MRLSIEEAARDAPTRIGLVLDGQEHDFRALSANARRMAARIDDLLGPRARTDRPPRVAFSASTDLPTVAAVHACWERGSSPVLLHPRLGEDEQRALAKDAGADLFFRASAERDALDAEVPGAPPLRHTSPEVPAAILFTSGTSGRPKGVVLSHRAFVASARGSEANLGWRDDDRWLLSLPLGHVGGLSILARTLLARRTASVAVFKTRSPAEICDEIARARITILSLVPTMLHRLLVDAPEYRFPAHVRVVLLGGAATSATLLRLAAERGVPALTTYGLTEACSQVTTQRSGTPPAPENGSGVPLLDAEVRIVDGEVLVRGPMLMSGYLQPDGTLSRPFDEDGFYATGDLGRLDAEGRLHLSGRRSELIITGGENVAPLEVEQALEACDGLSAACVFGVPDEVWGEIVAVAVVVERPEDAGALTKERLSAFVRERLPAHRRPRLVAFVPALALNATGKIDRRATAAAVRGALTPLEGATS